MKKLLRTEKRSESDSSSPKKTTTNFFIAKLSSVGPVVGKAPGNPLNGEAAIKSSTTEPQPNLQPCNNNVTVKFEEKRVDTNEQTVCEVSTAETESLPPSLPLDSPPASSPTFESKITPKRKMQSTPMLGIQTQTQNKQNATILEKIGDEEPTICENVKLRLEKLNFKISKCASTRN